MSDPDHHAEMEEQVSYGKQTQELRAEIARLRAYTSNPRYWEARWRDEAALTTEAAAFLDGLAGRIERVGYTREQDDVLDAAATDCRAQARKLRGET